MTQKTNRLSRWKNDSPFNTQQTRHFSLPDRSSDLLGGGCKLENVVVPVNHELGDIDLFQRISDTVSGSEEIRA